MCRMLGFYGSIAIPVAPTTTKVSRWQYFHTSPACDTSQSPGRNTIARPEPHSHSIVEGGFDDTS